MPSSPDRPIALGIRNCFIYYVIMRDYDYPDPSAGHTGSNVYGVNLNGASGIQNSTHANIKSRIARARSVRYLGSVKNYGAVIAIAGSFGNSIRSTISKT